MGQIEVGQVKSPVVGSGSMEQTLLGTGAMWEHDLGFSTRHWPSLALLRDTHISRL